MVVAIGSKLQLLGSVLALLFFQAHCDSLPSKAGKLTTGLVKGTLKGTSKAGYYLVQPKHVEQTEVYGLWRLQLDDGGILNLEITPKFAILVDDGRPFRMTYKFIKAKWPIRARIEFKTKRYFYKAILHRKIAARRVLKMKGKISRQGRWGGRKEVVHSFIGKRRLKLEVPPEEEAVEEEDYDSEDSYRSEESDVDEDIDFEATEQHDNDSKPESLSDEDYEYDGEEDSYQ